MGRVAVISAPQVMVAAELEASVSSSAMSLKKSIFSAWLIWRLENMALEPRQYRLRVNGLTLPPIAKEIVAAFSPMGQ